MLLHPFTHLYIQKQLENNCLVKEQLNYTKKSNYLLKIKQLLMCS